MNPWMRSAASYPPEPLGVATCWVPVDNQHGVVITQCSQAFEHDGLAAWQIAKVRLPFAVQKSGVDLDHRINVGHSDPPRKAVVKQTETDTLSVVEAAVTATVPSHFPHNTITIARCTVSSRAFASSIAATRFSRRCTLQCDLDGFEFDESAVDETQLRTLYEGEFITELRNLIFIGGTGTGKTHLAIAIAMHAVRER